MDLAQTPPHAAAELVPILWSESSRHADRLADVPHWPAAFGRLHLALAVVAPAAHGTVGVHHVTHQLLADHSFDELMAAACETLAAGLRVNGRRTADGDLLSLTGPLVSAAVCLPAFYRVLSSLAGAARLVVGLPGPDEVRVVAADSPLSTVVRHAVHESAHPDSELIPSVLHVDGNGVTVESERTSEPPRQERWPEST